jgi:hypothetical protein
MIWKWADRKDDRFVTFGHQEARIAALEKDLAALSHGLLAYVASDIASPWLKPANELVGTLQEIVRHHEGLGPDK